MKRFQSICAARPKIEIVDRRTRHYIGHHFPLLGRDVVRAIAQDIAGAVAKT
jgi:hypothetical protein